MADLSLLRSYGTVTQFSKGQIVFMENEAGDSMYIALKGVYGVYVNSFTDFPARVADIKEGDFFGEMSLIDESLRSATIISDDDGIALAVKKEQFAPLLEKSPDIAGRILITLQNRALAMSETVKAAGKGDSLPPLPGLFGTGQPKTFASMMELSHGIRQMNELLHGTSDPEALIVQPETAITQTGDGPKLLPDGYVPFNKPDENDSGQFLQAKKVVCPYCFIRSDAHIPAQNKLTEMWTDLEGRVLYKDFDILKYTNLVCPNCNFTDTYQEFTKFKPARDIPLYKGNRFENAENFTGFAQTHSHTADEAVLSYYLRLMCLKKTTNDPLRYAKAWIRLYWLYGDLHNKELEKACADKADQYYAEFLGRSGDKLNTIDVMRINALLGELAVTLGNYRSAMQYFEQNTILGRSSKGFELQKLMEECLLRYRAIKDEHM
jgi:hypothetical protein